MEKNWERMSGVDDFTQVSGAWDAWDEGKTIGTCHKSIGKKKIKIVDLFDLIVHP